jgi:putative ABC transport system permease protein
MQILQESLYLCTLSAILGSILGVIVLNALGAVPTISSYVRASWQPEIFLTATGTALTLGVLGGLYAAWKASRMLPVAALQYE